MPLLTRRADACASDSWRAAARKALISLLLLDDSSSRIEDWSRICCGLSEVSSASGV